MTRISIVLVLIATLIGGSYAVTCDSFDTEESCSGTLTDVGPCIWDTKAGTCAADAQGLPDGMVGVTSVETENADQALKPISLVPGPDTSERATENLPTNNTFCSQGPMQENFMGVQCTGYFPSWFYNATTDACEEYEYGGCGGTMNLFSTEKACTTSADKFCRRDEDEDEDEDADPLRVVVVDDVQEGVEGASGAHSVIAFSGLVFVIGALTYLNV